jgi:Glyoxalase-like domain
MAKAPLGLEHPLLVSDELDALAGRYQAMGFAVTPKRYDPWGIATCEVVLADTQIALAGIDDQRLIDEPDMSGFRFGRFVAEALARREGIAMLALSSENIVADAAALRARGVDAGNPADVVHEVPLPDGTRQEATVSVAAMIDWDEPALSFCAWQRPDLPRAPEWEQHPNGAYALENVVYAVPDPQALLQRFTWIWGEPAVRDPPGGVSVATAGGELLVLDRPRAEARFAPAPMPYGWRDRPCAIAITVRVADLNRVHVMMMQNRVPHLRLSEGLRIPPSHAGNVILDFVP